MEVNVEKLRILMNSKAGGNYCEFARQLGVNVAQLHRVMNSKAGVGKKFIERVMQYCKKNSLPYDEYIFLP